MFAVVSITKQRTREEEEVEDREIPMKLKKRKEKKRKEKKREEKKTSENILICICQRNHNIIPTHSHIGIDSLKCLVTR